jgi:hypothetical protein
MSRRQSYVLLILIGFSVVTQGVAQATSGSSIMIDYDGLPQIAPTLTDTFEVSEGEHISDLVKTDSSEIYLLLVDTFAAYNNSIVRYIDGKFSTRLKVFPPALGGLEILADSLFYIGEGYYEENTSYFLLTEMDLQGNTISEDNITLDIGFFVPYQLLVGGDDALYLLGSSYSYEEFHLIKMTSSGSIIWDKVVGTYAIHVQVLPSGQIFILNSTGLESRDINGNLLWYTEPANNSNWHHRLLHVSNDNTIFIESSYYDGAITVGRTIFKCDTAGTVIANTTLVGIHPTGTETDVAVDEMNDDGESIYVLLHFSGTLGELYFLKISRGLNLIDSWELDVGYLPSSLRDHKIDFTQDGAPIFFAMNRTENGKYLVAYTIRGTPFGLVLIAGGGIFVIGIVIVLWKRYK